MQLHMFSCGGDSTLVLYVCSLAQVQEEMYRPVWKMPPPSTHSSLRSLATLTLHQVLSLATSLHTQFLEISGDIVPPPVSALSRLPPHSSLISLATLSLHQVLP
uniref:Uncharacterized protein n=1 Tax=Timema genevievae TaxID=629358 RepID=A0A7R9JU71_TIMGE|nr:unnamed protein product [Timema genevievae]